MHSSHRRRPIEKQFFVILRHWETGQTSTMEISASSRAHAEFKANMDLILKRKGYSRLYEVLKIEHERRKEDHGPIETERRFKHLGAGKMSYPRGVQENP